MTEPQQASKRSAALAFDTGSLTIRLDGHGDRNGSGWFYFAEGGIEPVSDRDEDGYESHGYVAQIAAGDLAELRDWLNKHLEGKAP